MRHSIFALELCVRFEPGSPLRQALHQVVVAYGKRLSLHQKWQQYQRAASLLHDHLQFAEKGCWDYFDDDARALRDFDMWHNGMATEEGARRSPSGGGDPYRAEARYLTFTMALLMQQGTPTDGVMAQICNIPQSHLWHRSSFARILRGMGQVSFASVKSDVLYLIPRDDGWGLTLQDLADPKFHYLRQLV